QFVPVNGWRQAPGRPIHGSLQRAYCSKRIRRDEMKDPRTRKQTAPRNVAAKALRQGRFQPKVEKDPKTYSRKHKRKHKDAPLSEANAKGEVNDKES
ncbi:MAG: DUF7230 family protein, partial [Devosia sp.]